MIVKIPATENLRGRVPGAGRATLGNNVQVRSDCPLCEHRFLRQVSRFLFITIHRQLRTERISDPPRLYLRSIIDISPTRVLFLQ